MAESILFGFHAITARLRSAPASIVELYLDNARADGRARDLERAAQAAGVRVLKVPSDRIDGIASGGRHQGVVARVNAAPPRWGSYEDCLDAAGPTPFVLALDGVTDPHNLGAILRTADGAGVDVVIAPKDRAAGLSATAIKVASGAAESVPYFMVPNLARALQDLQDRGIWVVGLVDEAPVTLWEADFPQSIAVVMGAEGDGLRRLTRERCDALVRIPMAGGIESLNVSVAAGVTLYEVRRRLGAKVAVSKPANP
jgi:23S rRNA (guanosine2251-2'-O)-methyltransferase